MPLATTTCTDLSLKISRTVMENHQITWLSDVNILSHLGHISHLSIPNLSDAALVIIGIIMTIEVCASNCYLLLGFISQILGC